MTDNVSHGILNQIFLYFVVFFSTNNDIITFLVFVGKLIKHLYLLFIPYNSEVDLIISSNNYQV